MLTYHNNPVVEICSATPSLVGTDKFANKQLVFGEGAQGIREIREEFTKNPTVNRGLGARYRQLRDNPQ